MSPPLFVQTDFVAGGFALCGIALCIVKGVIGTWQPLPHIDPAIEGIVGNVPNGGITASLLYNVCTPGRLRIQLAVALSGRDNMIVGDEQVPDFPVISLADQVCEDFCKRKIAVRGAVRLADAVKSAVIADVLGGFPSPESSI